MLLTTITLNRRARGLTRDSQAMHRTIAHALDGRGLWATPTAQSLVVQHTAPIDWGQRLPGIIAHSHTIERRAHQPGTQVEWALIANPTAAIVPPGSPRGTRGKRRALPPEKWNSWVERKLTPALDIHRIDGTALPTAVGKRHGARTIHRRVLFTGLATVADPDALTRLQDTGVGPGKAYGCGLLITQEVTL
ncbi:type I-E CRISPR-associated protein Cas6/Cse3/CasE [Corynebacterium freneyi]|uniref:Type I-E CRISPR-associated protein Cas6/Cse3/CasE n=1 Tax=Corynebacterium freneyi TaxID=134034 RepID=A0ABS4U9V4_9CORY|nr:type I-E CRISPR-associated protein Cas6/Cse3/CasE [Corynebacterium freneyi]MBP2333327.1 hypothetical protein [Corynebacterium freneyi]QXA52620.1 type I-E CRISPR-associated protein Cas6/Cse3/CasE [Corynebacterium freneyi]WJZ04569.1 CRISPR-associated endoribonuclease Cse3 [Corynebacterium freneyi]